MADRRISRWFDTQSSRTVWLLTATSVADWPDSIPWVSERFGLFIAVDRDVDVRELAPRALRQGLVVVSTWGPGCTQLENAFDEAIVGDGSKLETVDDVILTTSHAEESLEEALDFFVDVLYPAQTYAAQCDAWVVFAIGNLDEDIWKALRERGARPEEPGQVPLKTPNHASWGRRE